MPEPHLYAISTARRSTSGTAHSTPHKALQAAYKRIQAAGHKRPPEAAQRLYKPLQDVVRKMGTGTSEAQ